MAVGMPQIDAHQSPQMTALRGLILMRLWLRGLATTNICSCGALPADDRESGFKPTYDVENKQLN
jgi:hypothetical protein